MSGEGILFVGDVVGSAGRNALITLLPGLISEFAPRFVVVNGENVAAGKGITPKLADDFFAVNVDAITLGNHAYRRKEGWELLDEDRRVVRPANHFMTSPGRGSTVIEKDLVLGEKCCDTELEDEFAKRKHDLTLHINSLKKGRGKICECKKGKEDERTEAFRPRYAIMIVIMISILVFIYQILYGKNLYVIFLIVVALIYIFIHI